MPGSVKDRVNNGELCRECLDELPGPLGHKATCVSCTRQLAWEEKRDEEYEAEHEADID